MMDSADRDDELVAHTEPECTRLCKGEMMRIRRHAAAHEARLSQHESPVILIAQANRFSQSTDCIAARLLFGGPYWCFLAGSRVRRAGPPGLLRDGMRRLITLGRTVTSTMRGPIAESLARNRSSTIFASAAISVFLAGRFRCAQAAASSAEFIAAICSIRLSRRLADSCTPRTGLAEGSESYPSPGAVRFPAAACPFDWPPGRGSSAAGLGAAPRSGASRSSSPAMPTSVKSAYRRA